MKIWDHGGNDLMEITEYEKLFLGELFGVMLQRRKYGKVDQVDVQIITEDDGEWHLDQCHFSSYWLTELGALLKEAQQWIEDNCERIEIGTVKYGWRFK